MSSPAPTPRHTPLTEPDGTGHDGKGVTPEYLRGWKAGRDWQREAAAAPLEPPRCSYERDFVAEATTPEEYRRGVGSPAIGLDPLEAAIPDDFGPYWDEVQNIDGSTTATFNRRRFAEAIRERLGTASERPEAGR